MSPHTVIDLAVVSLVLGGVRTGDGRIDTEDIGLFTQQLCPLLQNPQRLLFCQSPFAIEVIFEERYIRLGTILSLLVEELLWRRFEHGGGLYL